MKAETKIYHRIAFDLKKESDENEMNFDEVLIASFKTISYLCIMKKRILQYFGDKLLDFARKALDANDIELFQRVYDIGIMYDIICIYYFDVYLD